MIFVNTIEENGIEALINEYYNNPPQAALVGKGNNDDLP